MNIDKAIRKRKKSYKRFMLSMCFIFFILPSILIFLKKFYIFYIIYLVVIELLILLAICIKINKESLTFQYEEYKLKISLGLTGKKVNIAGDKIVLVHVENVVLKDTREKDFKIILLSKSKFRSDRMLPVSINFLKNHPYVACEYNRIKIMHPENEYYYTIVKRGGINKYPLLDLIYKNCVYAEFTEETVEKIKFYRENSEKYKI
ncbi:hypothetical protein [Clostridium scatologenes]|uniref:Transmembrane protein n=1 Tax=Clostridium scatologenes TaxID=1548 RepID=A0A0E3K376_CLOSL|nr:hypothetical protein [Clostridium scatologenes]AKA71055.1 hypothetical protein CSCA_3930 [Clostridium scatologenes]